MATLLHIDSSVFPQGASASRTVTDAFRRTWEERHPHGRVVYRDLCADPVPHITADAHTAAHARPEERTPEQAAAFEVRERLVRELEEADAVLIGAPMYNYTIPSTLKAWLDNVIVMGRTAANEDSKVKGVPVTVVASRGGSYAPGTPREPFEFVQNYLRIVLGEALGMDVDFIVPELTLAPHNPQMAELIPLFEASRERVHREAREKAARLVHRLAA
jgi:FMN-dependent NADH-azoreductase